MDGNTATSVSVGSGGKLHVDVAPTDSSGYSHNTYSDFSVPAVGAELDNTGAGARTIINEVTSQKRSLIEGHIEVLGVQADVILANPNGVTVNGGGFVNAGRALIIGGYSTGVSDGHRQFSLSDTDIEVGSEGLSGALDTLALIAKQISLSGTVDVGDGALTVKAASGQMRVDPNANSEDWLSLETEADTANVRLLISAGAHLSGGQITASANGTGAAVKMAGRGLASAGHFTLSADGKISASGILEAQKSIVLNAQEIEVAGQGQEKARIASIQEAVWLHARDNLSVSQAELNGAAQSSYGVASGGALSLLGEQTTIADTKVSGTGSYVEFKAADLLTLTDIAAESENELIIAAGSIQGEGLTLSTKERLSVLATKDITFDQVIAAADLGQTYEGAGFTLRSNENVRSQLSSKTAGLSFKVTGDFANYGGLIEGESQTFGDLNANGTVSVTAGGNIINTTLSQASIGAMFAKNGELYVEAGGDIINESGRLLSNGDISLSANNGKIANLLKSTRSTSEKGETSGGSKLFVSSQNRWEDYGTYFAGREIGQIIGLGDVHLQAGEVRNIGGQINGAGVSIAAAVVENSARQLGSSRFKRSCLWFMCRAKATSSISFDGGQMTATGALTITATENFLSRAGVLNGADGIELSAPDITFRPINYVEYFALHGGPHNLFIGGSPVTLHQQKQALAFSSGGKIRFVSDGVLTLQDANVFGDKGIEWPDNVMRLTNEQPVLDPAYVNIGWLSGVL
nr:filamentous hemagglutinin N-terminal domain-containing protein [Pseudovibrio sp. POLY-S9]